MAITFTTDLFHYVDTIVNSFVNTNVSKIANTVAPAIAVALTISYMMEGLFLIIRPSGEPLTSLFQKVVQSAIIISIASAGGLYQQYFANAALKAPDEFSSALIISQDGASASSMGSVIDQAINSGIKTTGLALDNAGITSHGLASLVVAICCIISTVIMCGVGAALIFTSKLMLGVVVSIGPLFIFMLLFNATRQFFERWCAQVVTHGMTVVIMSAVFGMMIYFFNNLTKDFANNPNAAVMSGVICALILVIVSWFAMKEIPGLAAGLGGGVAAASIGHAVAEFAVGKGIGAVKGAMQKNQQKKNQQKADGQHKEMMDALKGR